MRPEPGMGPWRQRLLDSTAAAGLLQDRIRANQPTSLIRLGDGEGALLARSSHAQAGVREYLARHFGPGVTLDALARLSRALEDAIAGASLLGLRIDLLDACVGADWFALGEDAFLERFRQAFDLRPLERDRIAYPAAWRLARLNHYLSARAPRDGTAVVSAWCHFDWADSGFLAGLVAAQERIGLVSNRAELARIIEHSGTAVDFHPVPDKHNVRGPGSTPHYPDRFEELVNSLSVAFPGQLFLIGAGLCGKVYCEAVRRAGGIAVDVGAVCDAWLGIASRKLVLRSRYRSDTVPAHLLLERQLAAATGNGPGG